MKHAIVPADIQLKNRNTGEAGETLSFKRYATMVWLDDDRWEKPRTNLRSLQKVLEEIEKAPGELMIFEDHDHEILKGIVEKPFDNGQPGGLRMLAPLVEVQLLAFADAIIHASSKHPLGEAAAPPKPSKK